MPEEYKLKEKSREANDEGDNGDDSDGNDDDDNDMSGIACMHLVLTSLLCDLCTELTGSTWRYLAAVAWSGYHHRDGLWQDTRHPWSLLQRSWHKNLNEDVNEFSHWRVSSSMIEVSKLHPPPPPPQKKRNTYIVHVWRRSSSVDLNTVGSSSSREATTLNRFFKKKWSSYFPSLVNNLHILIRTTVSCIHSFIQFTICSKSTKTRHYTLSPTLLKLYT